VSLSREELRSLVHARLDELEKRFADIAEHSADRSEPEILRQLIAATHHAGARPDHRALEQMARRISRGEGLDVTPDPYDDVC